MYVLNVTSQSWLDTSKAYGYNGDIWSHMVYIIVPVNYTFTDIASAYFPLTDNTGENSVISPYDKPVVWIDRVAASTGAVAVVICQLPNQPYVFADNPSAALTEDELLSTSWGHFYEDPTHNPEWLLHLPMVKGAHQSMRAVGEWAEQMG